MKKVIIFALFIFLVAQSSFTGEITDIEVKKVKGTTQVIFYGDDPFIYVDFVLTNPYRIVLDLTGYDAVIKGDYFSNVNRGGIESISFSRFKQRNFFRVVIALREHLPYSIYKEGSNLVVSLPLKGESFEPWRVSQEIPHSAQVNLGLIPDNPRVKLISLDLENAKILTVLRAFSEYTGRNIVADQEVTGNVTVSLKRVPWTRAFDIILKSVGLARTEVAGIIRVAPAAKLQQEKIDRERRARELEGLKPLQTNVYKLEFATAGEASGPLNRMLSKRGSIETDTRTNSLVITDIDEVHSRLAQLIKILDSPTPQVEIVTRIVEVNTDFIRDLGVSWGASQLRSDALQTTAEISVPEAGTYDLASGAISFRLGTITNWAVIASRIAAYEREGKASVVSNPRISAVNHQQATVFAGKQLPITTVGAEGRVTTVYVTAGITMTVTPHINSLDDVTLELSSEVSEPDFINMVGGLPTITTSRANTKVLLHNGETAVLGGLKKSKVLESETGPPILRHIPLIGNLFKTTGKSVEEREILIFVTPYILK